MDTTLYTDEVWMKRAGEVKETSRCKKKKLGCILLLKDGSVYIGANGPPAFLSQCVMCTKDIDGAKGSWQCRAIHAERDCILRAAMDGKSTWRSTLYSYMGVPCKDCMLELIRAGVSRIVTLNNVFYDKLSGGIMKEWLDIGGVWDVVNIDDYTPHVGVD